MSNDLTLEIFDDPINAAMVYSSGGIEAIIDRIESEAKSIIYDVSTAKGRSEIKSTAYKIARSKTTLDDYGKKLTADWRQKISTVDAERRKMRDRLDSLKVEIRAPLTEWEEEQSRVAEAEKLRKEVERDHDEALSEHSLWLREQEIQKLEAEAAMRQAEVEARLAEMTRREEEAREAAEAEERERLAAEQAKSKAEAEARVKIAEAEERERMAIERQKIAEEAEKRAKAERESAIIAARREADVRMPLEQNKEHATVARQKEVHNEVAKSLQKYGVSSSDAIDITKAIVKGNINHLQINY